MVSHAHSASATPKAASARAMRRALAAARRRASLAWVIALSRAMTADATARSGGTWPENCLRRRRHLSWRSIVSIASSWLRAALVSTALFAALTLRPAIAAATSTCCTGYFADDVVVNVENAQPCVDFTGENDSC